MRPADHDRSGDGARSSAPLTSEQKAILKAEMSSRLLDLARETGDQGYARAESALWQTANSGRPAIDDSAAIAEVEFLLSTKKAKTRSHALEIVARAKAPIGKKRGFKERLRRKLKSKEISTKTF